MTCKNCDECTAWNPFPWIDVGKMCEWTLLDSDEISILGIKIVIDESVPDGEVQFRTDNKVVGKIVGIGKEQTMFDTIRRLKEALESGDVVCGQRFGKKLAMEQLEAELKEKIECPTTSSEDSDHHTQSKKSS